MTARKGGVASPRKGTPGAAAPPRRRRFSLRDARIRAKLGVLLLLPLAAIVALASVLLVDSGRRAVSSQTVKSLTALSADISDTTNQIQKERMAAASLVSSAKPNADVFNARVQLTATSVATYRKHRVALGSVPTVISGRLASIDHLLDTLDTLRQQVTNGRGISIAEVVARYTVVIDDLVSYHGEVAQIAGNTTVAQMLRAKAAFAEAKAQTAQEQAVGFAALQFSQLDQQQYSSFLSTLTGQQSALSAFDLTATPAQRVLVDASITGDAVSLADRVAGQMARSVGGARPIMADELSASTGAVVDLMRWTEQQLDAGLLAEAQAEQNSVLREVVIESLLVVITLVVAVLLAAMVARSMIRSLFILREGALTVAERDLPAAVARLRDVPAFSEDSPEEIARQIVQPIKVDSRDEVGQVAQAFNVVHREAVRVAAEQSALRASVSAMFLNLARRSQTLVDRMIGELDEIERSEEDPKRLSKLFQLDHLATRMRRNDENLLVLAGADSSSPRRDDALLIDVVRAAQSEVEQYNRIEFATVDQDVSVTALVVNDVVRLLAELLDNATRFSPPQSAVVVDGRRIGDYVLLQIEDHGLGMSPEQMSMLNQRLAQPPSVDVASFRMMGLAVVARLSNRHGIKVELRPNPEGGTITVVTLPTPVLILPRLRGREPVLPRPRTMLAVERGPSGGPAAGLPMPSLPGLALPGAGVQDVPVAAGAPVAATVNGWAHASEINGGRPTVTAFEAVPPPQVIDVPSYPVPGSPARVGGEPTPVSSGAAARTGYADDTAELPIFRAMEAIWFRSHNTADELSASAFQRGPATGPGAQPPPASFSQPPPASFSQPPPAPFSQPEPAPFSQPPPASFSQPPPAPFTQPASASFTQPVPSPISPSAPPPADYSAAPTYRPAPPVVPAPAAPPPPPPAPPADGPLPSGPHEGWRTAADDGWRAAAAANSPAASGTTRSGLPKRVPAAQLVPGGVEQPSATRSARRTPEEVRGLLSAYHRGVQRGRSGEDERSHHEARPANPVNKETNR